MFFHQLHNHVPEFIITGSNKDDRLRSVRWQMMQKRQIEFYTLEAWFQNKWPLFYFMLMVKLNNYSLQCMLSHGEDVGLFPWTEESHLERYDSLMELCTVSAGRDSNSALRWAEKAQGYYCSCLLPAWWNLELRTYTDIDHAKNWDGKWSWSQIKRTDVSLGFYRVHCKGLSHIFSMQYVLGMWEYCQEQHTIFT